MLATPNPTWEIIKTAVFKLYKQKDKEVPTSLKVVTRLAFLYMKPRYAHNLIWCKTIASPLSSDLRTWIILVRIH
jgi:hypothetical protein